MGEYNGSDWKYLSLTLVEYPKDDALGKVLGILALTPLYVGAAISGMILRSRDLHTMFFGLGILLNEWLNMVLKYAIREPRPAIRDNYYVVYGMPSSHAQFSLFFTTYVILFLFKRLHNSSPYEKLFRVVAISACIVNTVLVCYGRVYLMYHTIGQVFVGSILGTAFGLLWFFFVHSLLTPYVFPKIVSWKISEFFLVRDTSLIPNIMFFEYTATRQESRARLRKMQKMQ